MHLAPFSPAAVSELAVGTGMDLKALFRATGGNPFFVTEALAVGGSGVPASVRDAVLARAARLSPPAQETLRAAAIVPQRIEEWLLDRARGLERRGRRRMRPCRTARAQRIGTRVPP